MSAIQQSNIILHDKPALWNLIYQFRNAQKLFLQLCTYCKLWVLALVVLNFRMAPTTKGQNKVILHSAQNIVKMLTSNFSRSKELYCMVLFFVLWSTTCNNIANCSSIDTFLISTRRYLSCIIENKCIKSPTSILRQQCNSVDHFLKYETYAFSQLCLGIMMTWHNSKPCVSSSIKTRTVTIVENSASRVLARSPNAHLSIYTFEEQAKDLGVLGYVIDFLYSLNNIFLPIRFGN